MPAFSLLHEKKGLGKIEAVSLCSGMDLLAYSTSSSSSAAAAAASSSSTISSGSIHIIRWVSWQRVFSTTLSNAALVTSSSISSTSSSSSSSSSSSTLPTDIAVSNTQHQRQTQPATSLSTIRWSPDGRMVSLQCNRLFGKKTSGGSSELLSIGHQSKFQTTSSYNANYGNLLDALASRSSTSFSATSNDDELVGPVRPSPLAWVVATSQKESKSIAKEIESNQDNEETLSQLQHEALILPFYLRGANDLIRYTQFPELLPPIDKDIGLSNFSSSSSSSSFLPWDSETVVSNLASNAGSAYFSHLQGGRQVHASILAYGSSVGAMLRLPHDIFDDIQNKDSLTESIQLNTQGLSLESAAESIAKLTDTLSTDKLNVESIGTSKATKKSGGVRGSCDDPTIVAASPSSPMPVLACLVPPPQNFFFSSNSIANSSSNSDAIALLAYGTFPLSILQHSGIKGSIEALSLSCDLSSLLDGGHTSSSAGHCSIQVRLHNLFFLSEKSTFLLHISSVYTQADSCLRSAARSILLMTDEWNIASKSVHSTMMAMEESISKNALNPSELAHLKYTASAFFPKSPVPLAAAELFRLFSIGSSTGSGFSDWLDASDFSKNIGAGNLAKLLNTIESAMAALETLCVTRVARSLELLILSISDILAAATKPLLSSTYTNMGVIVNQLEVFIQEAGHLLVLLQRLRSRALKARSIYSALVVYLRILRQQHQQAINLSAIADAEAEETATQVQAGVDVASTGTARRERRYRASAAGLSVSNLTAQDSKFVKEALRPRHRPKTSKYDHSLNHNLGKIQTDHSSTNNSEGGELLLKPTSDPLGIFGSIFSEPSTSDGASSLLFQSSLTTGTTSSDTLKKNEEVQEEKDDYKRDPFLNQSLSSLLGTEKETDLLKIFTGTHSSYPEEFPMSAYSVRFFENEDDRSTGEASLCSRLSSQMFTLCKRWTMICSTPSKILSSQCSVSFSASLQVPQLLSLSKQNALASSILRASCFAYQDIGSKFTDDVDYDIDENANNTMCGDFFKFGFHTCLLSLPPVVVRENLMLPSNSESILPLAIILRVALHSSTESPCIEASVVQLPERTHITSSSYFGPLPGAISSQQYESHEAGNGFVPSTSFPSDNDRFFSVVIDGCLSEIEDEDGTNNSSKGVSGIYLAQLDTRLLTFTKCVSSPNECLTWALKFAIRTRLMDCIVKHRLLNASSSSDIHKFSNENASAEVFINAVGRIRLDACGPRGAAVVVIDNKQLSVFDMTEDEESDVEVNDSETEEK